MKSTTDRLRFIDAHHHLWDLNACQYPWLMARGQRRFFGDPTPIQQNYLPDDFLRESPRYRPLASVHVQVGVAESQALEESRWLQRQADLGTGFPQAIVAYCDLAADDAPEQLDAQMQIANVRGIRQIIGRHPDEDRLSGSGALLHSKAWRDHLTELARRELSFDLQLIPPQLLQLRAILAAVPELRVALCHCGSPWDQSPAGLAGWQKGIAALAELPNVYCKISGLGMFNHHWSLPELRPVVSAVVELFGPHRCMFGSNFPVDKLYCSYERLWRAYEALAAEYTAGEREALFYSTAHAFYRLA